MHIAFTKMRQALFQVVVTQLEQRAFRENYGDHQVCRCQVKTRDSDNEPCKRGQKQESAECLECFFPRCESTEGYFVENDDAGLLTGEREADIVFLVFGLDRRTFESHAPLRS